jgi:hypothetical protein
VITSVNKWVINKLALGPSRISQLVSYTQQEHLYVVYM